MRSATLAASLLLAACGVDGRSIDIAHSIEEPAGTIALSISRSLEAAGHEVSIVELRSADEVLAALLDGHVDLAIIEEPDAPINGVRTLAPLYPSVLHVLHRRRDMDGGLAEVLDGAAVYAGPEGGAGRRLLVQLLEDLPLDVESIRLLDNPWTITPDVFFIFGGLLPRENYERLREYRLFSFAADSDIDGGTLADGIALRHHQVRPFLLPKGVYPALAEGPVLTLATRTILAARNDLDVELAFDVADSLFNASQSISEHYPLVSRELNESIAANELMLPLHPGTRRFLERDGPGYIERNVDVIALFVTLVLAGASGLIAFARFRHQQRKDRVDRYYRKLIDIRESMADCHAAAARSAVLDVQKEVMELLVEERVAADASLLGFLGLSGQMIAELDRQIAGSS